MTDCIDARELILSLSELLRSRLLADGHASVCIDREELERLIADDIDTPT